MFIWCVQNGNETFPILALNKQTSIDDDTTIHAQQTVSFTNFKTLLVQKCNKLLK